MSKLYKNTSSRLAAIQILYSVETEEGDDLDIEVLDEKLEKRLLYYKDLRKQEAVSIGDEKPNAKFAAKLMHSVVVSKATLDEMIEKNLDKTDSIKHLNILLKDLLRCAIAELKYFDTPHKVVLKEYIRIASTFFKDSEVSFINGLLDKVAKSV